MNFTVFDLLDAIGGLAFAMSGATLAIKKRFDIFGVFVLAFVTSVGGGTIRDLLIGVSPVEWMRHTRLIITILTGAAVAIIFYRAMARLNYFVYLFDAIGLGLFTIAGIEKGQILDLNIFICIALGVITATFGGLLRDIITGEKPMLLTRKEIYASASAAGGVLYFLMLYLGIHRGITVPAAIIFIFLLRHFTRRYNITFPSLKYEGKHPEEIGSDREA